MVTIRSSIVGSYYRPQRDQEALYRSTKGDLLVLERQPDNSFDENAIGVFIDGYHVGYLGRTDAARYAPMMDHAGRRKLEGTMLDSTEKYPRIQFEVPRASYYHDFKN